MNSTLSLIEKIREHQHNTANHLMIISMTLELCQPNQPIMPEDYACLLEQVTLSVESLNQSREEIMRLQSLLHDTEKEVGCREQNNFLVDLPRGNNYHTQIGCHN
jgi:hypothetical protein